MFGITSGTILDVAIGLTVMYLMLSLVGTATNEIIATLARLRAKRLQSAMQDLIDDPQLQKDFYNSGIIAGVRDTLGAHPSYIASPNFALALINSLDPSKPLPGFADVRQSVQLMADCNIRDVLLAQIGAAEGDLQKLRDGVADWFDSAMDRVGGMYKRDIKYLSIVIGIALAILFNADSITVTTSLWQDPKLREAIVTLAGEELKHQPPSNPGAQTGGAQKSDAQSGGAPDSKLDLGALEQSFENANSTLKPLPVGWSPEVLKHNTWPWRVIGWIVTGLAVSFGAPFWFDLLSKFMNIRGAGDKPDRASDSA